MSVSDDYHGSGFSGVDSKGRFTLPVELRRRVKAGSGDQNTLFVNTAPGLPCLTGFGEDHLAQMKSDLEKQFDAALARGETIDRHRRARELVSSVERVTFDDGGRFSLPDEVRELMGIDDTLYFASAIWCFEIWAPERYLEIGEGSEMSRIRCSRQMKEWAASPKNPRMKGA